MRIRPLHKTNGSDNSNAMIYGQQLKKLLKENDIKVAQLARATGVSSKTIYQWLNGQHPRNLVQVKKISDYFQVTVDFLVFGQIHAQTPAIEQLKDEIWAGRFEVFLRPINQTK